MSTNQPVSLFISPEESESSIVTCILNTMKYLWAKSCWSGGGVHTHQGAPANPPPPTHTHTVTLSEINKLLLDSVHSGLTDLSLLSAVVNCRRKFEKSRIVVDASELPQKYRK